MFKGLNNSLLFLVSQVEDMSSEKEQVEASQPETPTVIDKKDLNCCKSVISTQTQMWCYTQRFIYK